MDSPRLLIAGIIFCSLSAWSYNREYGAGSRSTSDYRPPQATNQTMQPTSPPPKQPRTKAQSVPAAPPVTAVAKPTAISPQPYTYERNAWTFKFQSQAKRNDWITSEIKVKPGDTLKITASVFSSAGKPMSADLEVKIGGNIWQIGPTKPVIIHVQEAANLQYYGVIENSAPADYAQINILLNPK